MPKYNLAKESKVSPESIPLRQLNIPSRILPTAIQNHISLYLDAESLNNAISSDFFNSLFRDAKQWKNLIIQEITDNPRFNEKEDSKSFYKRANRLRIGIQKTVANPTAQQKIFNNLFAEVIKNGYEKFASLLIDKVNLRAIPMQKNGCKSDTFLHIAVEIGNHQFVLLLLENGVPVDPVNAGFLNGGYSGRILADGYGVTPLIAAAANGHDECVKLLLLHGANVNYQSKGDCPTTALCKAAERGHEGCVKLLLDAGAQVIPFTYFGSRAPLQLAESNNHSKCVDLIQKHMTSLRMSIPTTPRCIIS